MTVSPLPRHPAPVAFDDFYREHFVRVRMLVGRHFPACDAEEIAQETMTRCLANFGELDPARDPWPWVSMVARNAAIDSMRRNRRTVSTDELPEARELEDATYESVVVLERRRTVRSALARLRPADRQLLEDHDLAGIGCAEIAAIRDVTPNTLRQQVFRARGRLATELRRVGAALGVTPAALHARFERIARRLNDLAPAAPVAGAWGAGAMAGVVTAIGLFGGPGSAPATMALSRGGGTGEPVPAVERSDINRADAAASRAAAPVRRPNAPVRPIIRPDPGWLPPLPYTTSSGDPINEPEKPTGFDVVIPTPIGPFVVHNEMGGGTPGYTNLCSVEYVVCPEEEEG